VCVYIYNEYSALGPVWQEPEPSQATGMAPIRCILGRFLGVVCHCFPPYIYTVYTYIYIYIYKRVIWNLNINVNLRIKFHIIAQPEVYNFKYSQHDSPGIKMKQLELIGIANTV
jgi:hypothetical protein